MGLGVAGRNGCLRNEDSQVCLAGDATVIKARVSEGKDCSLVPVTSEAGSPGFLPAVTAGFVFFQAGALPKKGGTTGAMAPVPLGMGAFLIQKGRRIA